MKKPEKYKNKYRVGPNRWQFWDYSAPAKYFITICMNDRKCILGHVANEKMYWSEYGKIVADEIKKMPEYHKRVILDEWIVMPNHIHLIIMLGDYGFDNGIARDMDVLVDKIHEFYLPIRPIPIQSKPITIKNTPWWNNPGHEPTSDEIKEYRKQRRKMIIPKLLGKLQMQTSKQINLSRNTPGTKNWQTDYHDHVIRDDASYWRIKNYIMNNPKNWKEDKLHVQRQIT